MDRRVLQPLLILCLCSTSLACDNKDAADELKMEKTKSVYDLKQAPKEEMSEEELQDARRKAGFKSPEEQMAEAKETYDKMERGYIKGRVKDYRSFLASIGKKLDEVEKAAPKWTGGSGEAAFKKFNEKFKEQTKTLAKTYDDLTEKGSRGGNTQVELDALVSTWENFNNDLGPEIAEADGFATALSEMREAITKLGTAIDEIEKDESVEAEAAPDDEGDKKK